MKRSRRTFSTEFKHEAASLVLDQGYSIPQASRSPEIGETALRRWLSQLEAGRGGVKPTAKALTPEQQRIQELEARGNWLEWEKAILKKLPLSCVGRSESYALIDELSEQEPVGMICQVLDVPNSSY